MEDQRRRRTVTVTICGPAGAADVRHLHPPVLSGAHGDGIPSLLLLRTNSDNQPVAGFCSWRDGSLSVSTAAPCPAPWQS